MSSFSIVNKIIPSDSFKVKSIIGKFDLNENNYTEKIEGDFNLPESWQIGAIVGSSGSGKTSIARSLYNKELIRSFEYSGKSIIDDMPTECSADDISKAFNNVGFSSPPSWLKPYKVLSNGEKMRVDLARALLENNDLFVFDEFTSVVDRQVAKIGSFAVNKAVRKTSKKFIAVSCHYDILEWLEPDWIFDTASMSMKHTRGLLQRPELRIEIRKEKGKWKHFRKYHYLNHAINNAGHEYTAYINDELIGFISILHFPNAHVKNIKKVHRLVILPDYQGLGIGIRLLEYTAKYYKKNKFKYTITTSQPSLCAYMNKSEKWVLKFKGRVIVNNKHTTTKTGARRESSSLNRMTTSWEYK